MTFQTVPLSITGPTYQSRSRPLSSQQTKNWYQQFSELGKEKYVLMPYPGLLRLGASDVSGIDRGLTNMAELAYQVKGVTLYSIDASGEHLSLGTVPGVGRCIFANDGFNLFIVTDLRVFHYDGNFVSEVLDSNIRGAKSVDFFNNQFIYTKDRFSTVSDVGDGSSASGLNVIGEETLPDDLVRDFVFDNVIYRCGVRSIVAWWNNAALTPPIERLEGRTFNVGLGAIHSIAKTDDAFYWLGDDNIIYRSQAGAKQAISSIGISHAISEFTNVSDAFAFTYVMEGQTFYQITFPSANKTFTVNDALGENGWFEVSSGLNNGRSQSNSLVNIYGKNIVADVDNGYVYELNLDTFTNNNDELQRSRVTQSISGKPLGAQGKRVQMSSVKLIMETGVGVIAGQGDNPRILIEYSDDGGRSWKHGSWPRVGRLGEFTLQVEWFNLGVFYERILRISSSDPVNYSIYSATIDLRLAGK